MRKILLALALAVATSLASVSVATADPAPGPIQVSGQSATTSQQAGAASSATQTNPSNTNVSIRVLSPGDDGNVSQANTVGSSAAAGNQSSTSQDSTQAAGGSGIQSSQQTAGTSQLALALSAAAQAGATNTNVPIRVLSPGNSGNVTQSNDAGSRADAGNRSDTSQDGAQSQAAAPCGCSGSSGTPVQTSDQSATTDQGALAGSSVQQVDPSNTNVSIRVLSPGNDGNVSQANNAASSAAAGNDARTEQDQHQSQAGDCGCNGSGIQQAGQTAETGQDAGALSGAGQAGASNDASPARVASDGGGGSVSQQNSAGSSAAAGNRSSTHEDGSQSANGAAIQIAKQEAATEQAALAGSEAVQLGASNESSPVRVDSSGNDGNVTQRNDAGSSASAGNDAYTDQHATQSDPGSRCGCGGDPIQVIGQQAGTGQEAAALSAADQRFGHESPCGCGGGGGNDASPTRVSSDGNGGSVDQSNAASSRADAGNRAGTGQYGSQTAGGGGLQIQALGQLAGTMQDAGAASAAAQHGASNDASPTRVYSDGNDGSVRQSNAAGSSASGGNDAWTTQDGRQLIGPSGCGCHSLPIQVAGQSAETGQDATGLSEALQLWPSNLSSPVRVWSMGGGGSVAQASSSGSRGDAGNRSRNQQGVAQTT